MLSRNERYDLQKSTRCFASRPNRDEYCPLCSLNPSSHIQPSATNILMQLETVIQLSLTSSVYQEYFISLWRVRGRCGQHPIRAGHSMGAGHWQPHSTAVKITLNNHAQTNCNQCLLAASHNCLCIYRAKHNYNQRITLFLANFWMDVTKCNIGPQMGKFWMLPVITSATECDLY